MQSPELRTKTLHVQLPTRELLARLQCCREGPLGYSRPEAKYEPTVLFLQKKSMAYWDVLIGVTFTNQNK